ncbi:YTH domain-containing protein 1-like [Bacillus rossius redtenbacheri]|uniref:YTH domain-containing protein 1-like n=1 Tax=Bacillus rossius redtenbacheri TaxID=93214 RepID=UPI002FDD9517
MTSRNDQKSLCSKDGEEFRWSQERSERTRSSHHGRPSAEKNRSGSDELGSDRDRPERRPSNPRKKKRCMKRELEREVSVEDSDEVGEDEEDEEEEEEEGGFEPSRKRGRKPSGRRLRDGERV